MSIEGQSIAAVLVSTTSEPLPDVLGMATAILLFFLINLVAIAAFLATAAQAAASTPAGIVPALVAPADIRVGAIRLEAEIDRHVEAPPVATNLDRVASGPVVRISEAQLRLWFGTVFCLAGLAMLTARRRVALAR